MIDPELLALEKRMSELEREREATQRRLDRLLWHQNRLEERVQNIEAGLYFRTLRAIWQIFEAQKRKLGRKLLQSPLRSYYLRMLGHGSVADQYAEWIEEQRLAAPTPEWKQAVSKTWPFQPFVSIVIAIHNSR